MRRGMRKHCASCLAWLSLVLSVSAAESATDKTWTLATEDTELTLSVASNTLRIVRLHNPAQNWNWTPAPSPVPIPGVQGYGEKRFFRGLLSDVRIYRMALSPAEVQAVMKE
jgi:hypothetical protein